MNIVIVESPAKAKTINKYLGPDYHVLASFGHVRDLPSKDGSVDPDNGFAMKWEVDRDSQKRLKDIANAVKGADALYLATDPDREGEAISWHVMDILAKKKALKDKTVKRVVFNEITKSAIQKAMANPREIDQELVNAYLARRALDYLVGFTLSPVLWRRLPGARSAGRVQSVALRLVCDRELEIDQFLPQEYWTVEADLKTPAGEAFTARLTGLDGKKLGKFDLNNKADAEKAAKTIEERDLSVIKIESKPTRRNPYPPFTTSTLQQEASRKLGFSASHTMRVAQGLYEGKNVNGETTGLITYMRTDGVSIAQEAIQASRSLIENRYGKSYVPGSPRMYKSKAKNAQEAHEAIRPTDVSRHPDAMRKALSGDDLKLYDLIWKRTVASQMESAVIERTIVDITSPDNAVQLRASGSVTKFDGFLTLYQEGRDDNADDEDSRKLPLIIQADALATKGVTPSQHFTEPPPRYSEATLVKKMEELGIGRPSTYASVLTVLRDRNYVRMEKKRFIPEDKGRVVTAFLENFFLRYVEYDFTANLEDQLDKISAGSADWQQVLTNFWAEFKPKTEEVLNVRTSEVLDSLSDYLAPYIFKQKDGEGDPRKCPGCGDGRLGLKTSRYGGFIGCNNYPDCKFTRPLSDNGESGEAQSAGPEPLGEDPETGLPVLLCDGRFGPYIQLGEAVKGEKPKRASLPKDVLPDTLDIAMALKLLSLPRTIGNHPESGKPITASIGRYGPYLAHDGKYANLPGTNDVFEIGINRAVTVIAEAANRKGRATSTALKELGEHPDGGGPVRVMDGRYGPYVKHGKINATIPKGSAPEALTMEQAIELLKARAEKMGVKGKAKPKAKAKPKRKKAPVKSKA